MEALQRPSSVVIGQQEEEVFGWQLVHDRPRNLVFYLHSYTGEVRWLPPQKVGFVMRGMHALPASSDAGDDWSPYFPHVVATPSGLMPVHVDECEAMHQSSGPFNRFPLVGLGVTTSGERLLPPTWEDFGASPPFLPPYPVAVLPSTSPASLESKDTSPLPTMMPSIHDPSVVYDEMPVFAGQRHHPIDTRPTDVPGTKEHNRKGYIMRQTRKLMKELGMSTAGSGRLTSSVHPIAASPARPTSDPTAVPTDAHKQLSERNSVDSSPSLG